MRTLSKKQKKHLLRILLTVVFSAVIFLLLHFLDPNRLVSLCIALPVYLFIGYDVLYSALRDIGHGQLFGEKFLMAIATVGALALGEVMEAVAVMLFFQVGELFESIATAGARKSLSALASLCPDEAIVLQDGEKISLPVDEVEIGALTQIAAGGRIPLDGVITKGEANFDFSSLTGEARPVFLQEGDTVPSGVVVLDAPVTVRTTHSSENSSTARILALMEEATEKKGKHERFITRFSLIYTPCVVFAALVVAFVLPIFAEVGYAAAFPDYLHRALSFLVISCPCALVISVPLAFFGASGAGAKKGVIFKSNAAIEMLASARTAYFDKTGTLTEGKFAITQVIGPLPKETLLTFAAAAESGSNHPLAKAFAEIPFDKNALSEQKELRGNGVAALYEGKRILCGKKSYLAEEGVSGLPENDPALEGTSLYLSVDGCYGGTVLLADLPKQEAASLFASLNALSVKGVILSGDSPYAVAETAKLLSAEEAYGGLLPEDKVAHVEKGNAIGTTVFAGDGINDAPVLATAGVGFAMGGLGSDIAIEAADAVVTDDNPEKVAWSIRLSRFSLGIVKQNITFALLVKFAVLLLSFFGYTNMWMAIFADVGVSVLAILNAIRALRFR